MDVVALSAWFDVFAMKKCSDCCNFASLRRARKSDEAAEPRFQMHDCCGARSWRGLWICGTFAPHHVALQLMSTRMLGETESCPSANYSSFSYGVEGLGMAAPMESPEQGKNDTKERAHSDKTQMCCAKSDDLEKLSKHTPN